MMQKMSSIKISKTWQVTLPCKIRKDFDLKEGDYLDVKVKDGAFIFKPVKVLKADELIYEKVEEEQLEAIQYLNQYAKIVAVNK